MTITVKTTVRANGRGIRVTQPSLAADQIIDYMKSLSAALKDPTVPLVNEPVEVKKGRTAHEARITGVVNAAPGEVTVTIVDFYTKKPLGSLTLFVRVESDHPQPDFGE